MNLVLLTSLLVAQSFPVGNTRHFSGFVPERATAIEVARPIIRKIMGEAYVKEMEQLTTKSAQGRWVVKGS